MHRVTIIRTFRRNANTAPFSESTMRTFLDEFRRIQQQHDFNKTPVAICAVKCEHGPYLTLGAQAFLNKYEEIINWTVLF